MTLMKILGIDTSCDETAIALVKIKEKPLQFKILSNVVSSQIKIHRKYGGVFPTLAKREHEKNLLPVLKKALKEANFLKEKKTQKNKSKFKTLKKILFREKILLQKLKKFFLKYQKPKIDLIAVTFGPGLEPCLWKGINFAKALSFFWKIPLVATSHIKAHIFSALFNLKKENWKNLFPALALVVSGGETQLILMENFQKYKILGKTRDDAAGECFDKTARILGLKYPGGPEIAKEAQKFDQKKANSLKIKLPRPMIFSKDYDFSFAGLKTAVLYDFQKRSENLRKSKKYLQEMAKEIQEAICEVLIKKTFKALKEFKIKSLILGGGVISNQKLRKEFEKKAKNFKVNLFMPPLSLCTDNGAMVALAGYFKAKEKGTIFWEKLKAKANLKI